MEKTQQIRVMIVDDHDRVRQGLNVFMNCFDDFYCVGEANNAEAAIQLCEKNRPDVILMDLIMPGKDGIYATQEIRKRYPETKVIALTSYDSEGLVEKALDAGAVSYLKKNVDMDLLADAIRAAFNNQATFSPEIIQEMKFKSQQQVDDDNSHSTESLSECERAILTMLVQGMNNAAIAKQLSMKPILLNRHMDDIFKKFKVDSRAELVAIALNRDYVTKP